MDGFAVCRALRAKGIRIPVLALTGRSAPDVRPVGEQAGFTSDLAKPIQLGALREALREALRAVPSGVAAPAVVARLAMPEVDAPAAPRRRGVLAGLVVIAMGVPFLLQPLGVPNAPSYLFLAMGVAFLISYLRARQYVYLIPMVTFSSFGIALLLPTWIALRPEAEAPAFVGVVALGFSAAFVLAPDRRWPLIPATLLGVVAGTRLLTGASIVPPAFQPYFVPLILVGVGCYLLVERRS